MTRFLKVVLAPLLVLALIGSTLYLGLFRPQAVRSMVGTLTSNEVIRDQVAQAFVTMIVEDENQVVALLVKQNEKQVVGIVSDVLAQPEQREQLADVAQQLMDGLLTGQGTISLDPRPIFRPLYAAISGILPLLELGEEQLAELDPIVFGEDQPMPDLGFLRTSTQWSILLWMLWLVLAFLLYRSTGKRAFHTVGFQSLIVGIFSVLSVLALPSLIGMTISDLSARALARTTLFSVSAPALWLGAILTILGAALLLRARRDLGEGVLPSQGAPDSQ